MLKKDVNQRDAGTPNHGTWAWQLRLVMRRFIVWLCSSLLGRLAENGGAQTVRKSKHEILMPKHE